MIKYFKKSFCRQRTILKFFKTASYMLSYDPHEFLDSNVNTKPWSKWWSVYLDLVFCVPCDGLILLLSVNRLHLYTSTQFTKIGPKNFYDNFCKPHYSFAMFYFKRQLEFGRICITNHYSAYDHSWKPIRAVRVGHFGYPYPYPRVRVYPWLYPYTSGGARNFSSEGGRVLHS